MNIFSRIQKIRLTLHYDSVALLTRTREMNNYSKHTVLITFLFLLLICCGCSKNDDNNDNDIISVEIGVAEVNLAIQESQRIDAKVYYSGSQAFDQKISWSSSNSSVATVDQAGVVTGKAAGSATITAKCNGKRASCRVSVYPLKMVDLGLSVKWADRNIGADRPESIGGLYAWGETSVKSDYSWGNYKWCTGGDHRSLIKYNRYPEWGQVDNKTTLEPADDIASLTYGNNWRTPTVEDFNDLLNKCDWSWVNMNGASGGYRVTSRTNGNSIFLPITGIYSDELWDLDKGYYWSSSLLAKKADDAPCYANIIWFSSKEKDWGYSLRYLGLAIRPVSE